MEKPMLPKCGRSCLSLSQIGPLEANPDIGGIGVLIGFVGTAWLVVTLVAVRYVLYFDPEVDPFHDERRDDDGGHKREWRPNHTDVRTVGRFRWLRKLLRNQWHWEMALTKVLLNLCDIQLLTGLGLLFSGFMGLTCYVSAYHWELICYLAWLSNLTHVACLSSLRSFFYRNQAQRNWRMVFMAILFAGLVAALFPTAYFNWANVGRKSSDFLSMDYSEYAPLDSEGTASVPSSNARCFFRHGTAQANWDQRACLPNVTTSPFPYYNVDGFYCNDHTSSISSTSAYESMILSLLLVSSSFLIRSARMFKSLSHVAKESVLDRLSRWSRSLLRVAIVAHRRLSTGRFTRRLVARLTELLQLYWLIVSATWGTVRLFLAREAHEGDGDENEWEFGQVLPVLLFIGPIFMTLISINAQRLDQRDRALIDKLTEVLASRHSGSDETGPTDRTPELEDHLITMLQETRPGGQDFFLAEGRTWSANEFPSLPLHKSSHSREKRGTSSTWSTIQRKPPEEAAGGAFLPLLNQQIVVSSDDIDLRASLSAHLSKSRWMYLVAWLFYLQIFALTGYFFVFVISYRPTDTLEMFIYNGLVTQPLNCLVGVVWGLYLDDATASKLRISVHSLMLVLLWAWDCSYMILSFVRVPFGLRCVFSLCPLGFLLIRYCCYLAWRR
ncbi:hypothetical protein CMUS01_10719 [Colletotrichum musicola]|uniref:Transmembrane protein n=1 Tax=Colletotrichum musicola TaxID=2175873 RepID=A0A8H6N7M4_9PEZI|nr:hypothetical protein CMUS01_10719 [Colletotrichum musicola]